MPGKRYNGQVKLSAARLVLEELIPVKRLTDQLDVPWYTFRRWAAEYENDSRMHPITVRDEPPMNFGGSSRTVMGCISAFGPLALAALLCLIEDNNPIIPP